MFLVRFIYRVVDIMFQDTVAIASFFLKKYIYIYIVWTFWTRFVKACDARFSPDVSLGGFWEGTCTYLTSTLCLFMLMWVLLLYISCT